MLVGGAPAPSAGERRRPSAARERRAGQRPGRAPAARRRRVGPSASARAAAARASASARPGPSGSGTSSAAGAVDRASTSDLAAAAGAASGGQVVLARRRAPPTARGSAQPAARAAREVGRVGRRVARAAASTSSRRRRRRRSSTSDCACGVALDRVGGELVDVGEDRLGEQAQRLGLEPARRAGCGEPPPGDPRADPVGGLQRVERPPLPAARRGRARRRPRGPARGRASGSRIRATNWRSASLDPGPDAAAEAPSSGRAYSGTSRAIVREDLLGDRAELGLDQLGDRRSAGRARARRRRFVIYLIRN